MTTTTSRSRRRSHDEQGRFEESGWQGQEHYEEGWEPVRSSSRSRRVAAGAEPEQRQETASPGGRGHWDEGYADAGYEQPRSRRRQYEEQDDYETSGSGRSWTGRRGFAAMDPERQREIASEGGRAPHRGPRGFAALNEHEQRVIASEGGRAPHRGPRGFAAMDQNAIREIASRGGRALHRGPRGFAAMDPEAQREIAARGGRASHGGWGSDGDYEPARSRVGSRRSFTDMDPQPGRRLASRGGRSRRD